MLPSGGDEILVVEDDEDLRDTIISALRRFGFHPVGARNGREALERLRNGPLPALILLDLMMPEMDGWRFRVEQKSDPALAATPVLVLTGDDSPQAAAIDADLYIRKPVDLHALTSAVRATIRRGQERREALTERMVSLGTLAAGIAHEINNPLSYVINNLQFLERHVTEMMQPGQLQEFFPVLSDALEGAERIRAVMKQVRAFSTADEERSGPVDLHAALEASIRMCFNEIRHRARLVREYAKVAPVYASEGRLGQVFVNLLINAAHAIAEGRAADNEIRVRTYSDGDGFACVEVQDTGCGIPEEVRGRIFEPFFTTKDRSSGSGLGLSICYGAVTAWGGFIDVESEVGRGSTFRIKLRLMDEASLADSQPRLEVAPLAVRARILVIDDEPAVARSLARILGKQHEVEVVHSGEEAIRRPDLQSFDLVLCDLMMPTFSGIDVYEAVQRRWPGLERKLVFMSGGVFTDRGKQFVGSIPNECLSKPLDLRQLQQIIAVRLQN